MGQDPGPQHPHFHRNLAQPSGRTGNSLPPNHKAPSTRLTGSTHIAWKSQATWKTLGGGNSTSTSNLVGFSLGIAQLVPLEMAPRAGMTTVTSRLHMENEPITLQTQAKASHLLRLGNHRQVAATWTTSRSSSIKIGAPQSLSRHRGTMYLNTSTCWAQTQQSHQAHTHMRLQRAMKHPALNRRLKVSGSRLPRTARFQMSWKTMTFHHSPWHRN